MDAADTGGAIRGGFSISFHVELPAVRERSVVWKP